MWTEELPWMMAFFIALLGVEMQFKYCVPCLRLSVKAGQAFIMVGMLRLWANRETLLDPEQWKQLNHIRTILSNKTI
jgi:hypothetical protein|tara:strand:+ start:288 stop:518 length:231 start_codon:yes stop_codon:yes gene_type:complete